MKKLLIFPFALVLFTFHFSLFTPTALAEATNGCQPVFGGGSSCVSNKKFSLDKKVKNLSGAYVDSLGINDDRFGTSTELTFRILVVNTTNSTLKNLVLTDILPNQLSFISADNGGKFDPQSHSVTVNIASMDKDEEKLVTIKARTPGAETLGDSPLCLVNQAYGAVGRDKADDNTRFCLSRQANTPNTPNTPTLPNASQTAPTTKGGLPIAPTNRPNNPNLPNIPTATPVPNMTKGGQPVYPAPQSEVAPNTGPEAFALIGLIPTGLGGLMLRKKSKLKI